MEVTWEWEGPTLAEQVLLLSIEQSRAQFTGQLDQVQALGEQMIGVISNVVANDEDAGDA